MKKALSLLLALIVLTGCRTASDNSGLGMRISKKEVSWKNSIIEFSALRENNGFAGQNPAVRVKMKYQDGKRINMPIDDTGLGYGSSFPRGTLGFYKPDQGLAKAEILSKTADKMTILLSYNKWTIYDEPVSLDKQITLFRDTPLMEVYDYYEGNFELLNVAAGLTTALVGKITEIDKGFSIYYPPYDVTSVIIMPDANGTVVNESFGEAMLTKEVVSGQPIHYFVGISDKGLDYLLEELTKIM